MSTPSGGKHYQHKFADAATNCRIPEISSRLGWCCNEGSSTKLAKRIENRHGRKQWLVKSFGYDTAQSESSGCPFVPDVYPVAASRAANPLNAEFFLGAEVLVFNPPFIRSLVEAIPW